MTIDTAQPQVTACPVHALTGILKLADIIRSYEPPMPALRSTYQTLAEELVDLLASGDSRLEMRMETVDSASSLYKNATTIVNYSYSYRFSTGGQFLELKDYDVKHGNFVTLCLAGKQGVCILAALRATWADDVDVFRLFHMPAELDKKESSANSGSIGRFAMHPAFDALAALRHRIGLASFQQIETLRLWIVRELVSEAFRVLHSKGVDSVYSISHAPLNTWLALCGVHSERISDATVLEGPLVERFRELYPGYWSSEPAVYRLDGVVVDYPHGGHDSASIGSRDSQGTSTTNLPNAVPLSSVRIAAGNCVNG